MSVVFACSSWNNFLCSLSVSETLTAIVKVSSSAATLEEMWAVQDQACLSCLKVYDSHLLPRRDLDAMHKSSGRLGRTITMMSATRCLGAVCVRQSFDLHRDVLTQSFHPRQLQPILTSRSSVASNGGRISNQCSYRVASSIAISSGIANVEWFQLLLSIAPISFDHALFCSSSHQAHFGNHPDP
jgi:hypothetical protein